MTISIRKATPGDFSEWWRLRKLALKSHPSAFGSTYEDAVATPEADAQARFDSTLIAGDNAIFAAFLDDGTMVGITGFYRESGAKEVHRGGIWGVFVDPIARGQQLGSKLMDAALDHAKSLPGLLQVELTVAADNTHAFRTYERAGFQIYGRHPRGLLIDGIPFDEYLMVLMLDDPTNDVRFDVDGEA